MRFTRRRSVREPVELSGTRETHAEYRRTGLWIALAIAVSFSCPAYAGPGVGEVLGLVIDPLTPTTLYAATDSGVFKSTDAGGTWLGLPPSGWRLAINPLTPTTLFAAGGGVFKSTDAGATWSAASAGLPINNVTDLAINPLTPTTLYVGVYLHGVFKSTDAGVTWAAANTGLSDQYINVSAINPLTPTTLYVGIFGGSAGVFKSTDAGGTWSAVNTGLTNRLINTLAIDPLTPTTLYAGGSGGVFKSTDAGGTWSAVNTGLTTPAYALAINPLTPTTLYVGTWTSGTGGVGGVFKSTNAGATWTAANNGLTYPQVLSLAIDPLTPTTLYAGTVGGGVFKSIDAGASWFPTGTGSTPPVITSFTASPSQITRGQSTTLSWTSTGGTSASIDNGVGTVPTSGSKVVSPATTTTYTLSVTGPGGTTTRPVMVTVGAAPPAISSFLANPTAITAGQSTTLSWASSGGTSATIDQGVGAVATSGSKVVSPTTTTTYTLSVTGGGGTTTGQVTVTVTPAAVCSLSCSATVPSSGTTNTPVALVASSTPSNCSGSLSYSWNFGDGTAISIQQNPTHAYTSSGTYSWSVTTSISGVTCTRTGTITINAAPSPPPILFVHGFCSSGETWADMVQNLQALGHPERYGHYGRVDLFFDGQKVRNRNASSECYPAGGVCSDLSQSHVYTITYYDSSAPSGSGFDSTRVVEIPIENLGYQLQKVVEAINDIMGTGSIGVDVVAHSMGGLVSRAYVQGLARNGTDQVFYVNRAIRQIITIDTPHGGAGTDCWIPFTCQASNSKQRQEMSFGSAFLLSLNSPPIPANVSPIPGNVFLTAIATKSASGTDCAGLLQAEFCPGLSTASLALSESDGVVTYTAQDITQLDRFHCAQNASTIPNIVKAPTSCLLHNVVLGLPDTAFLVDFLLSRTLLIGRSCQSLPAFQPASIPYPATSSSSSAWRVTVSSTAGLTANSRAGTSNSLSPECTIDIVVRGADGSMLGRRRVTAGISQTLEFGVFPSGWHLEVTPSCDVTASLSFEELPATTLGSAQTTRLIPIVLDVNTGAAHFTTEVSLTNRGSRPTVATLSYVPSLGTKEGAGQVGLWIEAGQQIVIGNILSHMREAGLSIPDSPGGAQQGGTLRVMFDGCESDSSVEVNARTGTSTTSPQPTGRASLAYEGLQPDSATAVSATICGLRQTSTDRSNVAVFNVSPEPVTVRVTAFSGDGSGYSAVVKDGETLPGFGWVQYSGVLQSKGITQGWVAVEKTSGSGNFSVYGVINDNITNDGSFVLPTASGVSGSRLTVPVLVETSSFRSELVLANRSSSTATLTLRYVESGTPSLGAGGTLTLGLAPKEQLIIPEVIDRLRSAGIQIGARDAASYVGTLRISVSGAALSDVDAGARTASQSPAGGQFGLFTPCVYEGQEATDETYLYGLRADAYNRSNVAVENSGPDGSGTVTLELRTFDGDVGGAERGSPQQATLAPGQFKQFNNILVSAGVRNGWVRIQRLSGSAPWIAYGVINDGGSPGEGTGDGAYVPMAMAVSTSGGQALAPVSASPLHIDGSTSYAEWGEAPEFSFPNGVLRFLHDDTFLYVLIDVRADNHFDPVNGGYPSGDFYGLFVDSNGNGVMDIGEPTYSRNNAGEPLSLIYSRGGCSVDASISSTQSSAHPGFGPTPGLTTDHVFWELALKLSEISASPGSTVHFSLVLHSDIPAIYDSFPSSVCNPPPPEEFFAVKLAPS